MSNYYQDYQLMTREEKLTFLHGMFHAPSTSPADMEIIQAEFKKVLNTEKKNENLDLWNMR